MVVFFHYETRLELRWAISIFGDIFVCKRFSFCVLECFLANSSFLSAAVSIHHSCSSEWVRSQTFYIQIFYQVLYCRTWPVKQTILHLPSLASYLVKMGMLQLAGAPRLLQHFPHIINIEFVELMVHHTGAVEILLAGKFIIFAKSGIKKQQL